MFNNNTHKELVSMNDINSTVPGNFALLILIYHCQNKSFFIVPSCPRWFVDAMDSSWWWRLPRRWAHSQWCPLMARQRVTYFNCHAHCKINFPWSTRAFSSMLFIPSSLPRQWPRGQDGTKWRKCLFQWAPQSIQLQPSGCHKRWKASVMVMVTHQAG